MLRNPKVIQWTIYILLGLSLLWGIDKLISTFYVIESENFRNEINKSSELQKQELHEDNMFYSKVDSLVDLKHFAYAIKLTNDRIKFKPDDKPYLTLLLGNIFYTMGDTNSAILKYTEAINSTNMYLTAYVARGWTYLEKRDFDKAIKDFEFAASNNFDYYYDLGIAQEQKGLIEDAKRSYEKYLEHYPENDACRNRLDSLILITKKLSL